MAAWPFGLLRILTGDRLGRSESLCPQTDLNKLVLRRIPAGGWEPVAGSLASEVVSSAEEWESRKSSLCRGQGDGDTWPGARYQDLLSKRCKLVTVSSC